MPNDQRYPPNGSAATTVALHSIIYLANAIDLKCEKAESALTIARKEQLEKQLQTLTMIFQREYATFLGATEIEPMQNRDAA